MVNLECPRKGIFIVGNVLTSSFFDVFTELSFFFYSSRAWFGLNAVKSNDGRSVKLLPDLRVAIFVPLLVVNFCTILLDRHDVAEVDL